MKGYIIIGIFIVLLSGISSASLGISPAFLDIDFKPGEVHRFKFTIISDDPNKEIELFLDGDLAKYATLSDELITGSEVVYMDLKLPESIETPGVHGVSIGATGKVSEQSFLGTKISISTVVKVFVPYPGVYVESVLNVPDGNVHDEIPIELHSYNRGWENVFVNVLIDYLDEGKNTVYQMPFSPVQINVSQDRYFRKLLNTSSFRPGTYMANALIDFGNTVTVNKTFRIGSLSVDVNNFTERIPRGGIQKYHINIESKWNNKLREIYADVNFSNGTKAASFRTPSVDLKAWEKKYLEGFLDTSELEGEYDVEIVLNYLGETTVKTGKLEVYSIEKLKYVWIAVIVGVLLLIVILVIFIKSSNKKSKRKK